MNVENRGELTTHHDKKIATGASKRRWQIFLQISKHEGGQKGCHFYIHYERCIRGVL